MARNASNTVESDCPNCLTRDAEMRVRHGASVGLTCVKCRKEWAGPTLEIAQAQTPDEKYRN